MRLTPFIFIITVILITWSYDIMAMSRSDIQLSSHTIPQGDLSLIRITVKEGETPKVTWMGDEIFLIQAPDETCWQGFIVADLNEKPGRYPILVKISQTGQEERFEVKVVDKDYGVRRLTLPKKMVDLDSETLKRVKRESGILKGVWDAPATIPAWNGPFLRPVQGDVIGPFGRRSIINDQPRSPHTGVDLRGEEGSPVKAINNGRVVLTANHFFSGKSIILDHGGEVMSMYFHLKEILVDKGDTVKKGQIIGLVGSTGRATGPHLHWGMRINGARINPLSLISLSQELEE